MELGRLTKRLYLCFDDAAGQEATLRGMQLAVGQGFDVRVVALPKGQDPADAPDSFALASGTPRATSITARIAIEKTDDRQEAFVRAREILAQARTHPSGRRRFACSPIGSPRPRRSQGWRPRGRPSVVGRGAARGRDAATWKPDGNANVTCSRRSSPTLRCSTSSPH